MTQRSPAIAAALLLAAVAVLGDGCTGGDPGSAGSKHGRDQTTSQAAPVFEEVAAAAGFTHRHRKPLLDSKLDNIMSWVSSVGAAAATADYDGDGWLDLFVTSSRKGEPNYLYRNNGDGTFTDRAATAGLAAANGDPGTSMDAVWGDYDNDGLRDLYLVRWGRDALYRNLGDGTFREVTAELFRRRDGSRGTDWANGNAVIFWDYNLDGRVDIYVGNYFDEVDLWNLETTSIMHDDFEQARNGGRNFLYRQEQDGRFVEVAAELGVDDPGWTLAVGSADLNNDGYPDLYCADDFGPDQLFLGGPQGRLTNVTESAIGLDTKKGMNVDFGDFNNDGWLDIYVTNITTAEYLQEGNMLWHNNGSRGHDDGLRFGLTDISMEASAYDGGWGWGAKFLDYDNDGDLDVVSVNGFISAGEGNYWYDLASWTVESDDPADSRNWPAIGDRSFSGYEATRFFRNDGFDSFVEVAATLGIAGTGDGRGVVSFDYDNDGDLDVFVANQDQPASLYRNRGTPGAHWLGVELRADPATGVNRDAIGARVTIVTAGGHQIRERDGGAGYAGQSDPRLHFGLGSTDRVELLEVRWPDGGAQYLEDVAVDRYVTVRQDPALYSDRFSVQVAQPVSRPRTEHRPAVPEIDPEKLERLLAEMETKLRDDPADRSLPGTYRRFCADNAQHDRAIGFLGEQVAEHPDLPALRLEYGAAFIDKIPTRGGLGAIVSKGTLARKSLDQQNRVVAEYPDSWLALYSRGMNHLHWPRALRHSDDAIRDFRRCVELQGGGASGRGNEHAYYLRSHVALGDAYAKNKQYDEARRTWQTALKLFPDAAELKQRLAVSGDSALLAYVEDQRNLEQAIDTDLTFAVGAHATF